MAGELGGAAAGVSETTEGSDQSDYMTASRPRLKQRRSQLQFWIDQHQRRGLGLTSTVSVSVSVSAEQITELLECSGPNVKMIDKRSNERLDHSNVVFSERYLNAMRCSVSKKTDIGCRFCQQRRNRFLVGKDC
nr:hypothetical protein [Ottowia sp. GY511]